jgi:hypothetical protein
MMRAALLSSSSQRRAALPSSRARASSKQTLRPLYFDVIAFEDAETSRLRLGVVTSAQLEDDEEDIPPPTQAATTTLQTTPAPAKKQTQTITVAPLRPSPCWQDSGLWVEDDDDGSSAPTSSSSSPSSPGPRPVPLSAVRAVLRGASLEQRQDLEHNPHGEHAHDVWLLPTVVGDCEVVAEAGAAEAVNALLAQGGGG